MEDMKSSTVSTVWMEDKNAVHKPSSASEQKVAHIFLLHSRSIMWGFHYKKCNKSP